MRPPFVHIDKNWIEVEGRGMERVEARPPPFECQHSRNSEAVSLILVCVLFEVRIIFP